MCVPFLQNQRNVSAQIHFPKLLSCIDNAKSKAFDSFLGFFKQWKLTLTNFGLVQFFIKEIYQKDVYN